MRGPRLRLLLTLLLLTACTATVLDARTSSGSPFQALRTAAATVVGPAQRTVGDAAQALPGRGSSNRLAQLQRDNDQLRQQLITLQGAQAQSDELAQLLHLRDEGSFTSVLARVIGYGAATPFENTVTLDVGSRDGVRPDQTVTSGRGLVGRTVQVGPDTSLVALLTDPTVTVGSRLNAAPRSLGLATGSGRQLSFTLLAGGDGAALQAGDAGSDTFVPGVPVGHVTAVAAAGTGDSTAPTATLEPYADLSSLDLLQVVVDGPRTEARVALPPS